MGNMDVHVSNGKTALIENLIMEITIVLQRFSQRVLVLASDGKIEPPECSNLGNSEPFNNYKHMSSSSMNFDNAEQFVGLVGTMANNAIMDNEVNASEQPNAQAQAFYDMLKAT